jgi:hypothetical protein
MKPKTRKEEKMKKITLFILVITALGYSYPDLVCPLGWKHIGSTSNKLIDSFEVHSYLQNRGDQTATSPLYPSEYSALTIGVDSFNIKNHSIITLNAGYFREFVDTITVLAISFSVHSHCDPLGYFQNGWNVNNDVYSYGVNIHPTIKYDTVTLVHYDTVNQSFYVHDTTRIKDTLRITTQIHDTLRIVTQIRDTIIKSDTLRITKTDTLRFTKSDTVYRIDTLWKHDTLKTSAAPLAGLAKQRSKVYGEIYNVIGQCVWKGYEIEGAIPRIKYSQGIHVLIQGSKRKMFRVLYN